MTRFSVALLLSLLCTFALTACGSPQYVTDKDKPDIDTYTMSLRFDRMDLNRLYMEIAPKMFESPLIRSWDTASKKPSVAIFPMRNDTSEHIDPQLNALLSKMETDFVQQTRSNVVSHENQIDIIGEVKNQQDDVFDSNNVAAYGKQIGAQYFVTGKVYDAAERVGSERRVQYFMFIQIIEVATGAIKFQHEAAITKGLVK